MKVTENFTKEELERSNTATRLGLPNICPSELTPNMLKVATHLEQVRFHYGAPVNVLSCYRAPGVNSAVGGSATSAHRFALAADFTVQGRSVKEVCKWCSQNIVDFDQIIYEFGSNSDPFAGWIHMGFSNKEPRKQCLTATKDSSKTVYSKGF